MKFKELMILLNDLNSDLEYLRLKIFDLKVSNHLNTSDKVRLNTIDMINKKVTEKAIILNEIGIKYILKKTDRKSKKTKGVTE